MRVSVCCIVLIFSNTYVWFSFYSYSCEQQSNKRNAALLTHIPKFYPHKNIKNKQQHTISPVNMPFCYLSFIVYMNTHIYMHLTNQFLTIFFLSFLAFSILSINFHQFTVSTCSDVILLHFNDKFVTFHFRVSHFSIKFLNEIVISSFTSCHFVCR